MTIYKWIKKNRKRIDEVIEENKAPVMEDDDQCRGWVLNHAPLYWTAIEEGVEEI